MVRNNTAHCGALILALAVPACGQASPTVERDEYAHVDVEGTQENLDSLYTPTRMGTLPRDRTVRERLSGPSKGYPVWTFEATRGERFRVMLESPDFATYLRVTSPNGQKVAKRGEYKHPIDRVYFSVLDIEAAETGTYRVLATSVRNMGLFPVGTTTGEFTVSTETEDEP